MVQKRKYLLISICIICLLCSCQRTHQKYYVDMQTETNKIENEVKMQNLESSHISNDNTLSCKTDVKKQIEHLYESINKVNDVANDMSEAAEYLCATSKETNNNQDISQNSSSSPSEAPEDSISSDNQNASNDTSDNETSSTEPSSRLRNGCYAVLSVPDVGIDVACYYISGGTSAQYYVDMWDSAAYMYRDYGYHILIIGDHNYQGFDGLFYANPGSTYATLYYDGWQQTYVCTSSRYGYNDGGLYYNDGTEVDVWEDSYDMILYTCDYNGGIIITRWSPV